MDNALFARIFNLYLSLNADAIACEEDDDVPFSDVEFYAESITNDFPDLTPEEALVYATRLSTEPLPEDYPTSPDEVEKAILFLESRKLVPPGTF